MRKEVWCAITLEDQASEEQDQMLSEHSDTDGDFVIKEEILEKAPIKESKPVDTPVKGRTINN